MSWLGQNKYPSSPAEMIRHRLWLRLLDRFELVDPAVGHQREEEMTVFHDVRPDKAPLLHKVIVQGARRALGARQRQRPELELIRADHLPVHRHHVCAFRIE